MKVVAEYITPIHLTLSPAQRGDVLSALNRHHVGKDVVGFYEEVPEGLKEAHRNVNMGRMVRLLVKVYEDGSQECEIA